MKSAFNLQSWLSDNRQVVINSYSQLTNEIFFNGITLKEYMMQVMAAMQMNNVKSANRAASMLPLLMGNIYFENSKTTGTDKLTSDLRNKYNGTAYMAML